MGRNGKLHLSWKLLLKTLKYKYEKYLIQEHKKYPKC